MFGEYHSATSKGIVFILSTTNPPETICSTHRDERHRQIFRDCLCHYETQADEVDRHLQQGFQPEVLHRLTSKGDLTFLSRFKVALQFFILS
jgi:hypothetical protein